MSVTGVHYCSSAVVHEQGEIDNTLRGLFVKPFQLDLPPSPNYYANFQIKQRTMAIKLRFKQKLKSELHINQKGKSTTEGGWTAAGPPPSYK